MIGGNVGVQVEYLPVGRFAEAADDGNAVAAHAGADRLEVNLANLAHQAVPVPVEKVGFEYAAGNRFSLCAGGAQRFYERHVGLHEHAPGRLQYGRRSHTQAVANLAVDTALGQRSRQLRPRAVHDDRCQSDLLQENQ